MDIQPIIQVYIQPNIQVDIQPNKQVDIQLNVQADMQGNIQVNIQPNIQVDIQSNIQVDMVYMSNSKLIEADIKTDISKNKLVSKLGNISKSPIHKKNTVQKVKNHV